MKDQNYTKRSTLPVSAEEAFAWHERAGAFLRLTPGWEPVLLEQAPRGLDVGTRVVLRVGPPPIRLRWVARHTACEPGRMFRDEQVSGPFAAWIHTHRFEPVDGNSCTLIDDLEYALPGGALGRALAGAHVRGKLEHMFAYRHRVTSQDLHRHSTLSGTRARIGVTGSTGMLGRALCSFLATGGHEIVRFVRAGSAKVEGLPGVERVWDTRSGPNPAHLEDLDAVVHLAGRRVGFFARSSTEHDLVRSSRVDGTRALVSAMRDAGGPKTLVSASAAGYYCDTGDEPVDESRPAGDGFLADLCKDWEQEAERAEEFGVRVVRARIGVVLGAGDGALALMTPAFKSCLGGPVGSGAQWFPWIGLDDAVYALSHCVLRDEVRGAVNLVAPGAVRQREFASTLGRVLGRPAVLPTPGWVIRAVCGRMGREAVLGSCRATPGVLVGTGFVFAHGELSWALAHTLGRSGV